MYQKVKKGIPSSIHIIYKMVKELVKESMFWMKRGKEGEKGEN